MTSQENNLGGQEYEKEHELEPSACEHELEHSACEQVHEMLGAYLDLELSEAEFASVDSHLSTCSTCQSQLKALEALVDRLKALPEPTLSRDLADSIAARLEKAAPPILADSTAISAETTAASPVVSMQAFADNKRRAGTFRYAAAAAVVAVLAAGVYFFSGNRSQTIPTLVAQAPTASVGEPQKKASPTEAVRTNQKDVVTAPLAKNNPVKPVSKDAKSAKPRKVEALATVASADKDDVVDAYDDIVGGGVDDYGISTNEDGLYAIQL